MTRAPLVSLAHFGLLLLALGCTPPSEERATLDRDVGRQASAGLDVEVRDGLATIQRLDGERLRLWCSAPEVVVTVVADEARPLTLELLNVMRDARLSFRGAAGDEELIALSDDDGPTRKSGTVELARGENVLRVTTSDSSDRGPWRFALMSDVQTGIDDVQDLFRSMNGEDGLRFLLGAGDLSQRGTREELERFQRELRQLLVPYYTTLGNHDIADVGAWQQLFGRGSFRFVFRGVQFTLLDSASATVDPLAYGWLDGWLDEGRSRVNIFAMHIPALDPVGVRNGAFGSRNEAGMLLSRLRQANVAMTLYGHIHSLYQFENGGIPAFISGGGGALGEKLDGIGRHYLVLDVGADAGIVSTDVVAID